MNERDPSEEIGTNSVRQAEYDRIRCAYDEQPDSGDDADDWSNCEEFNLDTF